VRKIAAAVAPRGNSGHLLKAVGLDLDALRDPHLRIPYADMMLLSELASRITNDAAFGLHVGEHVEQNSYGIVGCSVVSSATLGDALRSVLVCAGVIREDACVTGPELLLAAEGYVENKRCPN